MCIGFWVVLDLVEALMFVSGSCFSGGLILDFLCGLCSRASIFCFGLIIVLGIFLG